MSGLFLPRPDFIKPAARRINKKHTMAPRLCFVFNGWDRYEAVQGALPTYVGYDGGNGVHPSHMVAGEVFDFGFDGGGGRSVSTILPHGQSNIVTVSGVGHYVQFPGADLYNFVDYNKPWSWWWQGRPNFSSDGAVFAWGVRGDQNDYRGFDLYAYTSGTSSFLSHIIRSFTSNDAKQLGWVDTFVSYQEVALGFSYNGVPSGASGTSEFVLAINGRAVTPNFPFGVAGPITGQIQPPAGTDITFWSRKAAVVGTGDSPGYGETRVLAMWDRALSADDFKNFQIAGLPFDD